ncbi:MAG: RNA methyltransferase, partial [Deltaproteobacteria bacterium]|nr:RNA methyltransferase [Deltaproteobacteria bacterium]
MPNFFAITSKGLAETLALELEELEMKRVNQTGGGVSFEGSWEDAYRANLRLRTATRVILSILDFPAYEPDQIYHNILKHDFTKYVASKATLAVESGVKE